MPAVHHPARALFVVALSDLTDPVRSIANHSRQLRGRVPLGQQPEDLPPRAFVGLFRRPVAPLQVVDTQMRLEVNASCHASILPPPTLSPYYTSPPRRSRPPPPNPHL